MKTQESRRFYVLESGVPSSALQSVRPFRRYRLFFGLVAAVLLTLILMLGFLPWQQTAFGFGRVIAFLPNDRQQEINAPIDGVIKRWYVGEGSKVRKGQPIVDLSDNDPEILERLRSEREATRRRLDAATAALRTSKLNLDRQKSLLDQGLSARRTYEQANLELTRYLVEEANAAAELARMDVRLSRQMTQSVVAPVDGTILRVVLGEGAQIVKQGAHLAMLVPDTESRAVELFVDGMDMPLLSEGDPVRLQFEGWPALQFSGWPSVAVGTFGGRIKLVDAADDGDGKFRILVLADKGANWPDQNFLRQGVRAQGWVLLRVVSLGFEVWRRFNGFPPTLSSAKSATLKGGKASK